MVFAPFYPKTVIDFARFGLESGIVFDGATVVYEYICRLVSKWIRRKNEKMRIQNQFWEISLLKF